MRLHVILIAIYLAFFANTNKAYGAVITVAVDTTAFIDHACIRYETDFELTTSPAIWEGVTAHPLLFGMLWEAYGFEPPYAFEPVGGEIHIVDGSGLEGYLSYVAGADGVRVLLARGRLKNWGLPIGVSGRALFILRWKVIEGVVQGNLAIYGEGTGSAADIVIKAFSPVLRFFINRRITANLNDFGTIVSDIMNQPQNVRDMLADEHLQEFDSFLNEIQNHSNN